MLYQNKQIKRYCYKRIVSAVHTRTCLQFGFTLLIFGSPWPENRLISDNLNKTFDYTILVIMNVSYGQYLCFPEQWLWRSQTLGMWFNWRNDREGKIFWNVLILLLGYRASQLRLSSQFMRMLIRLSFNEAIPVFVVIQFEFIVMYYTCNGEE